MMGCLELVGLGPTQLAPCKVGQTCGHSGNRSPKEEMEMGKHLSCLGYVKFAIGPLAKGRTIGGGVY